MALLCASRKRPRSAASRLRDHHARRQRRLELGRVARASLGRPKVERGPLAPPRLQDRVQRQGRADDERVHQAQVLGAEVQRAHLVAWGWCRGSVGVV
eukprot:6819674-Pyramimonas_sp.AAC.2